MFLVRLTTVVPSSDVHMRLRGSRGRGAINESFKAEPGTGMSWQLGKCEVMRRWLQTPICWAVPVIVIFVELLPDLGEALDRLPMDLGYPRSGSQLISQASKRGDKSRFHICGPSIHLRALWLPPPASRENRLCQKSAAPL